MTVVRLRSLITLLREHVAALWDGLLSHADLPAAPIEVPPIKVEIETPPAVEPSTPPSGPSSDAEEKTMTFKQEAQAILGEGEKLANGFKAALTDAVAKAEAAGAKALEELRAELTADAQAAKDIYEGEIAKLREELAALVAPPKAPDTPAAQVQAQPQPSAAAQ